MSDCKNPDCQKDHEMFLHEHTENVGLHFENADIKEENARLREALSRIAKLCDDEIQLHSFFDSTGIENTVVVWARAALAEMKQHRVRNIENRQARSNSRRAQLRRLNKAVWLWKGVAELASNEAAKLRQKVHQLETERQAPWWRRIFK